MDGRLPALLFTAATMLVSAVPCARSQASLDEIEAALANRTTELDRVDKLLADQDRNRRVAAMEALLQSGNPVFVGRAKEVGLFSSDRELREAALKSVFDAGGPFRLLLSLAGRDEEKSHAMRWSTRFASVSDDGKTSSYSFGTSPYDEKAKCWKFQDNGNCAFYLSGLSVSLVWPSGRGDLTLDADGALTGSFIVDGGTLASPARIPLTD